MLDKWGDMNVVLIISAEGKSDRRGITCAMPVADENQDWQAGVFSTDNLMDRQGNQIPSNRVIGGK